jgi:hypothetical protein
MGRAQRADPHGMMRAPVTIAASATQIATGRRLDAFRNCSTRSSEPVGADPARLRPSRLPSEPGSRVRVALRLVGRLYERALRSTQDRDWRGSRRRERPVDIISARTRTPALRRLLHAGLAQIEPERSRFETFADIEAQQVTSLPAVVASNECSSRTCAPGRPGAVLLRSEPFGNAAVGRTSPTA